MWFKKKKPVVPENGTGDALVAIAKEDPGALRLVGDIMERNTAENLRTLEDALEMEKAAHERTRRIAQDTRQHLSRIHDRVEWILGGEMPDEIAIKIEQIAEETAEQVVERERTVAL